MNAFERFQELKPQICENAAFMENLQLYAFHDMEDLLEQGKDSTLPYLGAGTNNTHYRIGRIGDLWFASREFIQGQDERDSINEYESYIGQVISYHEQGHRVPVVCGPVLARIGNRARYFLLLEDLTAGGTANFQPARRSGGISGFIDGVEVFHDFDDDSTEYLPKKYLADHNLLVLTK